LPGILSQTPRPFITAESPSFYTEENVNLALEIDKVMRENAPASWRGDHARELQILNALFPIMQKNRDTTQALLELLKNMKGYE
jgi:type I restriction enzyme R subunit